MSYMKKDNDIFIEFMDTLDPEQMVIYSEIVFERLMIYVMGMILGLFLGIYYILTNSGDDYRICKFLCIIFITKLLFYYFYPKQPLMLYSLKTEEQVEAWANIYSEMKNRWKKSIIVGLIGYLILSMSF
tara:strand:- start:83 stop:469 length:387 start_codon:yes stop_codon:yes gene_type:complete